MQKIFKTVAIIWEKAQCVCHQNRLLKRPFSLATPQLVVAIYQIGTGPTLLEAQRYEISNGTTKVQFKFSQKP